MKLLQRLPDATKEEVRNQIIVLLNQMTATNEEMKKTVGKHLNESSFWSPYDDNDYFCY